MSLFDRIRSRHRSPLRGLPKWHGVAAAVLGGLTLALAALVTRKVGDAAPFLVASMGATTFIVFLVPHSPMARPWPVLGGQMLSACIGMLVSKAVPDTIVALGVGTAAALIAMSLCRCMHPPGAASAVAAVLAGPAVAWHFPLWPTGLNAGIILAGGMVVHQVLERRPYPLGKVAPPDPAAGWTPEDLDAALARMPESLDISRADLQQVLDLADAARRARLEGRSLPVHRVERK